ncbi:MAG: Spy/CpxP family protein refolding chaperone [Desulfohalobiaceae bacterium]|nr:Spy/CpxP family protein refolding chaperone [Desulfohalobiaceae bacterium]
MKRRSMIWKVFLVVAIVLGVGFAGPQSGLAAEEHHQNGGTEKAPAADESMGSGIMQGSGPGDGSGMMGMMGKGMVGQNMMGQGMMRMMMSHMMGGRKGGMGNMMQQMMGRMMGQDMMGGMAPGMGRQGDGQGGMAQMAHMLENLGLAPGQWEQVHTLAGTRLEKMADLWAEQMKLRIKLATMKWDQTIDPQQVKDLFIKKAEARAEMFLAGVDYLNGLKEILTQEQLKKLETGDS